MLVNTLILALLGFQLVAGQGLQAANVTKKEVICVANDDLFVTCNPSLVPADYTGFDIELFRKASTLLSEPWTEGINYEFKCVPFPEMLVNLTIPDGNCTAGLGGITVTEQRIEDGIRFTYPTFRTSLAPLVVGGKSITGFGVFDVYTWQVWLAVFLTIPAFACVVFFLEYMELQRSIKPSDWVPGLKEAGWRSVWTMFILEPFSVTSNAARSVAWVYGAFGVVFVNIIQGQLTATLTVNNANTPISSPADLVGKAVQTLPPYAAELQAKYNLQPIVEDFTANSTENWLTGLRSGALTAVLVDEPLMQQLANTQGCDLRVVDFDTPMLPFDLAIGFSSSASDDLVRMFSTAIKYMQEDGTLEELSTAFVDVVNPQCQRDVGQIDPITLNYVWGVWVILCSGIALGLIILAVQLFMGHRRDKKKHDGGSGALMRSKTHLKTFDEARREAGVVRYRAGIAFRQRISMFALQLSHNKRYLKAEAERERHIARVGVKLNQALTHIQRQPAVEEVPTVDKLRTMCTALDDVVPLKESMYGSVGTTTTTRKGRGGYVPMPPSNVVDAVMDDAPLVRGDGADYRRNMTARMATVDDSKFEG